MPEGISIVADGRRISLKWHRLRRRMRDPLFSGRNLAYGLRLGASMEIDLRATGDFDFAVLHDETLEGETNGSGRVASCRSTYLGSVLYTDGPGDGGGEEGIAGGRRLMMLGDLLALLGAGHPDALLQLDMKDSLDVVGQQGVERLQQALGGRTSPLIVSGDYSDLILAIRRAIPELRRGIDPTDRLVELVRKGEVRAAGRLLREEIGGPVEPDFVYLSWPLLLHARAAGTDLVEICHGEGKRVDAWTYSLADPDLGFSDSEWREFSALTELRVDQITTDDALAMESAFLKRIGEG